MRSLDGAFAAGMAGEEIAVFRLLTLELPGWTSRWTNCDVPLGIQGKLYEPRGFTLANPRYSQGRIVDDARLDLDNIDDMFTNAFLGGIAQGAVVRVDMVLIGYVDNRIEPGYLLLEDGSRLLWEDGSFAMIETGTEGYARPDVTAPLFRGEIDDWQGEETLSMTLTTRYSRWVDRPGRMHGTSCPWKLFGNARCGYSGSETACDRTYTRCTQLSNTANFGGFRWAGSLETREIVWGGA